MPLLEKLDKKWLLVAASGLLLLGLLIGLLGLLFAEVPASESAPTEPVAPTAPPVTKAPGPYDTTRFTLNDKGYLTCLTEESRLGIDVSGFQGEIDWSAVAEAGVEFVFIRVGHRGNTEGGLYADEAAADYYAGAKAAGLDVGVYFYSQAITPQEAVEEAEFVLELIDGWQLELPVVFDWEWVSDEARTANLSGQELTACTEAFCQRIRQAGLDTMIYFNLTQGLEMLSLSQLEEHDFWLACYDLQLDFPVTVDFWQYSCTGSVPGITGDVDLNLQFVS